MDQEGLNINQEGLKLRESQRVSGSTFAMLEMFDLNLVILFLMEFMQLEICEEMQPVQMQRKYGGI